MGLSFNLDSIVQNASKIKLRGGMTGKICHVLICVIFGMAAIAWSCRTFFVAVLSLCMVFILTFMGIWRLINLAHKDPRTALMDGAELLVHEQMIIASKNHPEKIVSKCEQSENKPLNLSVEEKRLLDQPDLDKVG